MTASPLTPETRRDKVGALPTFVQRAISSVRVHDKRIPVAVLRAKYKAAEPIVLQYIEQTQAWIRDVDAEMVRRGADNVDHNDPQQCAEFLSRIDVGALERKNLREALVEVCRLELKRLRSAIAGRARDEH